MEWESLKGCTGRDGKNIIYAIILPHCLSWRKHKFHKYNKYISAIKKRKWTFSFLFLSPNDVFNDSMNIHVKHTSKL